MTRTNSLFGRPLVWMAVVSLFGLALAGCKTDEVAGPTRTETDAPLTSLEHPPGIELPVISLVDRGEIDLVEEMILHRAMYARFLRALATYYTEHGFIEKAKWARNELRDLQRVKPYRYILDAETPVVTLRPADSISEADRLYEEGLALMKKGGHGVPVFYHQETMKLALARFNELIDNYPDSDKVDDAAFQIAEIHKEYFEEKDNRIALEWYQRALDWNPNLPYPARFQMAVVYDFRLHEREKALALYKEVIEKETFNQSNVHFANVRITQLTPERTLRTPGEPVEELRPGPTASPEPEPAPSASVEASPSPARVP